MLIAILAMAMIFGTIAASIPLIAGWPLLAVIGIYSACGLLVALMGILGVARTFPASRVL